MTDDMIYASDGEKILRVARATDVVVSTARINMAMREPDAGLALSKAEEIVKHFAESDGNGYPSGSITRSPLCGAKHSKRTRRKRATQLHAEKVAELQAVGILPLTWWAIIWTYRSEIAFLFRWILEIMNETEEPAAAGKPLSTPEKGQT